MPFLYMITKCHDHLGQAASNWCFCCCHPFSAQIKQQQQSNYGFLDAMLSSNTVTQKGSDPYFHSLILLHTILLPIHIWKVGLNIFNPENSFHSLCWQKWMDQKRGFVADQCTNIGDSLITTIHNNSSLTGRRVDFGNNF